jgi:hypothetical protein
MPIFTTKSGIEMYLQGLGLGTAHCFQPRLAVVG